MNVDAAQNYVAFEIKRFLKRDRQIECGSARDENGIRNAWNSVRAKTGAKPSQVLAIYSEWEPSAADREFIGATFPKAQVSYSHPRPTADGWEAALATAAAQLEEVAKERVAADMNAMERSDANLYPVLRDFAQDGLVAQIGIQRPIGAGLSVYLAHVAWTPRGTIGTHWLMRSAVQDADLERLFETAWHNLRTGLQVQGRTGEAGIVFTLEHPQGLAAGALALPDFYDNAARFTGASEITVAIPCLDHLFLAAAGTPAAATLAQLLRQAQPDGELTPGLFLLNASGLYRC